MQKFTKSVYQNTGDDNSHPTHHLGMAHHKQLGLNKFTQPKVKVIRDACIVKKWIQRDSLTRCILHFEYMIKKMIYCNLLNEYLRFVHFEQGHYFKLPFKEIFKGKSIQII